MATYNFVVDGSYVNISGVDNTHARLHNSSQAIEWFYDGSGDLVFSIDDVPYLVKDMSEVIIDGVTLTDPSEFETNIKLIFPGYAGGSVAGFTSGAKLYVALLTQTGTDAPVATVLQNDLGGTVVFTYSGAGDYSGTLAGAFLAAKTVVSFSNPRYGACNLTAYRFDDNTIKMNADSDYESTTIPFVLQIIVYP